VSGSLLTLLRELSRRDVEYIVVGGMAGVLHGAPVVTADLDIVHRRTQENVGKLLELLTELDVRITCSLGGGPPTAGEQDCALVAESGPTHTFVDGTILVPEASFKDLEVAEVRIVHQSFNDASEMSRDVANQFAKAAFGDIWQHLGTSEPDLGSGTARCGGSSLSSCTSRSRRVSAPVGRTLRFAFSSRFESVRWGSSVQTSCMQGTWACCAQERQSLCAARFDALEYG